MAAILFATAAYAGSLTSATLAAWDDYVQSARMANARRATSDARFLWMEQQPEQIAKIRAGEILVSPASTESPKRISSGLIHDWVGAVFIPSARLNDVFQVVRDYPRYKEWFQPAVVDSKAIATTDTADRFSMLLVNRSYFKKMAIDADYESSYVPIDDHHGYSVAQTTRIQEVEQYGARGQHALPDGEGSGIIWRLFSITRYMERDGGVYVEIQAIGLSRDIPASLRWFVEPIVRRVSRASLMTSLRQTAEAVRKSTGSIETAADRSSNRLRSRP